MIPTKTYGSLAVNRLVGNGPTIEDMRGKITSELDSLGIVLNDNGDQEPDMSENL